MAEKLVTFVYGTLRPGEGNYWIEPAVEQVIDDCTTRGVMYASSIPYVDFDGDGTVIGTLLVMDLEHRYTHEMVGMERGAGYQARQVEVTTPDGELVTAWAWHHGGYGQPRHESGDWRTHHHSAAYRRRQRQQARAVTS
jgi:gamma-glutamylcyclotransferase (GGCT)/AIG2-like uncharacterized protein YtfP